MPASENSMNSVYQILMNSKLLYCIVIACMIRLTTYLTIEQNTLSSTYYLLDKQYSANILWSRIFHWRSNITGIKLRFKFQPQRETLGTKLFITSFPNHGAGVGHQFDEWIQGLWAAHMYNLTYVFTPFLKASAHWNKFLYFHLNELVEQDVTQRFRTVHVKDYYRGDPSNLSVQSWIIQQQEEFSRHKSMDHAMLLRLHCLGDIVNVKKAACFTPINIQLRTKYCIARYVTPVRINLYKRDRLANRFVVAIHLRCGDSCYDSYRATSLISVENTILQIHSLIYQYYPKREVVFHLFSQSPHNGTAEQHFGRITHNEKFRKFQPYPIRIVSHFSLSDPITLHHLIMSDVLLTAQSGFSLLAAILRIGVTFGPITSCQPKLTVDSYDKRTGNFSWNQLTQALNYSEATKSMGHTANNFNPHSMEHCLIYEKNTDIW